MSNYVPSRPQQAVGTHILLALFTGGIGNIIYYCVVKGKQSEWDRMYGNQ